MKRVLFIEDDWSLQKIYVDALKTRDIQCISALTGKDGFDKAKKELPDLIILDIMLPGGQNGFDILTQLKRDTETSNIPVLVLTNLDSEQKTALSLGAVDYVVKANTSLDQVLTKIEALVGA